MKKNFYHFIVIILGLTAMKNGNAYCCNNGFYLEENIGYVSTDWQNSGLFPSIVTPKFTLNFDRYKNGHGGFVFGTDAGYLFNRFIGVEIGGFILPDANAHFIINTDPKVTITGWDNITDWLVYTAGKFIIPINKFDLFFKAGAAYRNIKFRGRDQNNNSLDINGLSFIGGSGVQYHVCPLWNIEAQWLYVNSYTNVSPSIAVPSANLFFVGVILNLSNLV